MLDAAYGKAKARGKQGRRSDLLKQTHALRGQESPRDVVEIDGVRIELADALSRYANWPAPTAIISDGPYGLGLFPGDPRTVEGLVEAYEPHIAAWSRFALPETTLWFWCSEIGWATVHPLLAKYGWLYRSAHVWDKGIGHIAGNVNSKTIRKFPVVTELCVQYIRDVKLPTRDGELLPLQAWLRHEWVRSGLPLSKTNDACGVKNAASRKYFTSDHLWYFPPAEMMERLTSYANAHGLPDGRPYFSIDGIKSVSTSEWEHMRAKWNHAHGVTNVWSHAPIHGLERVKDSAAKAMHANQKPLALMKQIIEASTDSGDMVWEPFGGLCTGAIASLRSGRACLSAEIVSEYFALAKTRLERASRPNTIQGSLFRGSLSDDDDDETAVCD